MWPNITTADLMSARGAPKAAHEMNLPLHELSVKFSNAAAVAPSQSANSQQVMQQHLVVVILSKDLGEAITVVSHFLLLHSSEVARGWAQLRGRN